MKKRNQVFTRGLLFLVILAFAGSCASIPELKVNYRLPPPSNELKGKGVLLVIQDARKTKEILGQGARKELKGFSGNFSLSIADYKEKGFKIGIFQVPAMMREVFKRRLQDFGLRVLFEESRGVPQLSIVLKEFYLDLVGYKWVVRMSYEAKVIKDGEFLASQMLNGQAERFELMGHEEADVAVEEIFTDMVNRLDIVRLFKKAGL